MRFSLVRLVLGLAFSAVLLAGRTREQFPGLSGKWHYYQSPHFELYSLASDWESRDALQRLELIRAVFLDTFKLKVRRPLPVTVFDFETDAQFNAYLPESMSRKVDYVGLCQTHADRSMITLAPVLDPEHARQVVYHEFVHYLFYIAGLNPPRWYNEGVAELYSTLHDVKDAVDIGLPAEGRVLELRDAEMLPFDQLFGLGDSSDIFKSANHTGVFYAESWAFLHYCQFGSSHLPPERVHQFLDLASSERALQHPVQVRQACRELLGCDYPELQERLRRYIGSGDYHYHRFPRPKIDEPQTYSRRDVPSAEIFDRLAELSLRSNRAPNARLALLQAIDRSPTDPRPWEVLGNDAATNGDDVEMRERWGKAVDLGTTNPAVVQRLAEAETRRWFEHFDLYFRLPEERAAKLRGLLRRSIALVPEQSEAYEMLAWVESAADKIDAANVNLVQSKFSTVNHRAHTLLALALIYVRINDRKGARQLLAALDKFEPDRADRSVAGVIGGELDRREETAATNAVSDAAATPGPADPAPAEAERK